LEDPGVDGIILKWTCERLDGGAWTGSIWLKIGTGECGYEPSGSINAGNFLSSSGRFSFSGRTLLHGVSKLFFGCSAVYVWVYNKVLYVYIENVSMISYCIVNITSLDWPAYAKDQKPGVFLIACPVTFLSVAE
jgi:hypothetical protein